MHQDVGTKYEAADDLLPARIIQIGANAPLIPIATQVDGRLAMPQRGETAAIIAAIGPFNLNYIGAKIAEQLRAIGTCEVLRQVNDYQAFERPRHPESFLLT
jgi:hypothetical protein